MILANIPIKVEKTWKEVHDREQAAREREQAAREREQVLESRVKFLEGVMKNHNIQVDPNLNAEVQVVDPDSQP
jgi:hypothetical protein